MRFPPSQRISFSGVLHDTKGVKSWVLFYVILYFISLIGYRPTQWEEARAGVINPLRDTLPYLSIPATVISHWERSLPGIVKFLVVPRQSDQRIAVR